MFPTLKLYYIHNISMAYILTIYQVNMIFQIYCKGIIVIYAFYISCICMFLYVLYPNVIIILRAISRNKNDANSVIQNVWTHTIDPIGG